MDAMPAPGPETPPFFARLHNRRGERHLNDTGDLERAAAAYARAVAYAPAWSVPWYNLGFVRKLQGQWAESLHCNLRAAELDPEDEAAWWNAGIAATALGDWASARKAWAAFGITLPPGEGEVIMELGRTPIRLNPDGQGEVVWCDRIDPARVIVRNVPLPESGHRYGDLMLHDGAPEGTRQYRGREVPVFDALQLLRASPYATYQVQTQVTGPDDVLALAELAEEQGCGIEDWETIRRICAACSRGSPGPHAAPEQVAGPTVATLAIAARDDIELGAMLNRWAAARPGRAAREISILLPGAPQTLS